MSKSKTILNDEEVIDMYVNGNYGVESLALALHVGKLKIKEILNRNGISIKKRGGQSENYEKKFDNPYAVKYEEHEGKHYIAVAKDDKSVVFNDYLNVSGCLTSYIKNKFGVDRPSTHFAQKEFMQTGNYWYEKWFDIIEVDNRLSKKCPYCDWETVDVDNKTGWFEMHLKKEHNVSPEEHLKKYPEDAKYFTKYISNIEEQEYLSYKENYVVCPICGEKMRRITNYHVKKHGYVSVHEFKKDYPNTPITSKRLQLINHNCPKEYNESVLITLDKAKSRWKSLQKDHPELVLKAPIWQTYVNWYKPMKVYCHKLDFEGREHGEFSTSLWNVESRPNASCVKCGREKTYIGIDEAKQRVSTYSNMENISVDWSTYVNATKPFVCYCHKKNKNGIEHGRFSRTLSELKNGVRCPKCAANNSEPENEIYRWVCDLFGEDNVIQRTKKILDGQKEIDIYVPEKNVGIEYNGLYWHSEGMGKNSGYHVGKLNDANSKGIELINIFEDKWMSHSEAIKNHLLQVFGKDDNFKNIDLRYLNLVAMEFDDVYEFLCENSLKEPLEDAIYLVAEHNGIIYVCLTLNEISDNCWEFYDATVLNGYKTKKGIKMLFDKFVKVTGTKCIEAELDRCWFNNKDCNAFTWCGMSFDKVIEPRFMVCSNEDNVNRKVWDCGYYKYVWNPNGVSPSKNKHQQSFMDKLEEVNAGRYDLSEVVYTGSKKKITLICPIHGKFEIRADAFLAGQGCRKCADERRKKPLYSTDEFIEKAKLIHGDKYDYTKTKYTGWNNKCIITCPIHGDFEITPNHYLSGEGCKKCGIERRSKYRGLGINAFVEKSNIIHNGRYKILSNEWINEKTPIKLLCPIHGEFEQTPDSHLHGAGCPACGHQMSKVENEIYEYACSLLGKENVVHNDTNILDGLEIDIYLPNHKLGIEYNGLHWHTEAFGKDKNYHLNKTQKAEEKGIHLIQIFEDEWLEHKYLILDKIRHFLNKNDVKVIGARKCKIQEINNTTAEAFLKNFHIQGFSSSTLYYGAFYNNELVGVMTFLKEKEGMWNLTRFTTDYHYSIPGLANKIFKHFVNSHKEEIVEVKTFLDRRWSHSSINVYDRMGFVLTEILKPDYRYVVGNQRLHKFGFRKQKLNKKYGLPLTMTEREMCKELGFERIWDCGLYKYVWKNY